MTLEIAQDASAEDQRYWSWSVWINCTEEELREIDEVVWKLHPTFPEPNRRVTNRQTRFRLETSGWGEFEIVANVRQTNGRNIVLRHWLHLQHANETTEPRFREKTRTPRSTKAVRTRSGTPSVFVSYTLSHAKLAGALAKALRQRNFNVTLDVDVPPGVEYRRWMTERIGDSDALVVLGADEKEMSRCPEIEVALNHGIEVIPIALSGSQVELPENLQKFEIIQVKNGIAELIAPHVAERIDEIFL